MSPIRGALWWARVVRRRLARARPVAEEAPVLALLRWQALVLAAAWAIGAIGASTTLLVLWRLGMPELRWLAPVVGALPLLAGVAVALWPLAALGRALPSSGALPSAPESPPPPPPPPVIPRPVGRPIARAGGRPIARAGGAGRAPPGWDMRVQL